METKYEGGIRGNMPSVGPKAQWVGLGSALCTHSFPRVRTRNLHPQLSGFPCLSVSDLLTDS